MPKNKRRAADDRYSPAPAHIPMSVAGAGVTRRRMIASLGAAGVALVGGAKNSDAQALHSTLTPVALTCEHLVDPLGIDRPAPRLVWKLESRAPAIRGQKQAAWQIIVASRMDLLTPHRCDVWNSGKVISSNTVDILYAGKALPSHQRCFWRVRIWDITGALSAWSKTAVWTMGVMDAKHWAAQWIGIEPVGGAWKNYALHVDLKIKSHAAGVFFRTGPNGDGYLWQLNTYGPTPVLKEHVRQNGAYRVLKQVALVDIGTNAQMARWNGLKIVAEGANIRTFINGHQVDVTTDHTLSTGAVGFREAQGETAIFKNLRVIGPGNQVLLQAPLEKNHGHNPFTHGTPGPQGMTLSDAKAYLGGLRTPLLRREIVVKTGVKRAWMYASALGIYQLFINARPVSRQLFAPGDTNYFNRIDYQTYDVTELLQPGANVIGAMLAPGWYAGHIGWFGKNLFGSIPALFAQLHIEYAAFPSELFATDSTWTASPGPVVYADNLMGETYDARLEQPGWNAPAFKPATPWRHAGPVAGSQAYTRRLAAQMEPPVRAIQEFPCRAITAPKPGLFICDFGQLITGVCRLKVRGPSGTTVTLRYGEWLKPDGTLFMENLRAAKATDRFILNGNGREVFQPGFTFHGFRYVEVTGYPGTLRPADITGILTVTDAPVTGAFKTNQPLVNKLQSCIFWTGRDTDFSIPMAVPDRNERLGWSGDINFFSRTAVFNFDLQAFYANWLGDLNRDQTNSGVFGNVAPLWMQRGGGYGGGWGDVGICLPYLLYEFYGDVDVVQRCWPHMVKNLHLMEKISAHWILPGSFAPAADWLNVHQPTPPDLIATAYFAYDTLLMSRLAHGVANVGAVEKYAAMFQDIAKAFQQRFIKPNGVIGNDSQTGYVMALFIGLVPPNLRARAAARLVANIRGRGDHLATGFVGAQWLLDVLTQTGHHALACRLIQTITYPSWGYEVARGSTTLWEAWNAVGPDGQVLARSPNPMANPNSLCAPPLAGSVGDWLYRHIGGISPDFRQPGFRNILIRPRPGGRFLSVSASLNSIRGRIRTQWTVSPGHFSLQLLIPPNTRATVCLPAKNAQAITEGGKPIHGAKAMALQKFDHGMAVLDCQSGSYDFQCLTTT